MSNYIVLFPGQGSQNKNMLINYDKNHIFNKYIDESVKIEIKKMLTKYSHKDVVEFICKKENLPKKLIYEYCLKLKK